MRTGKGPKAATSVTSIREAQRRTEMLELRLSGLTLEQIGERMGVGKGTVSRVISSALTAQTREPADELLRLELGRCDLLLNEAMQTARAFHPLVIAGRVVRAPLLDRTGRPLLDPATGEVLTGVIEDKAPKLAAVAAAVRVMERRAKLLGLDAPGRLQQDLNVTGQERVQDMTRLDDTDLGLYCYLISKATDTSAAALRRDIRCEIREKLTATEIGTLQDIFRKLDVPYLAAESAQGMRTAQLSPSIEQSRSAT